MITGDIIDIHLPPRKGFTMPEGEHEDTRLQDWGRPELALALRERDADVTFSRGSTSYDLESGQVTVLRPRFEDGGLASTVTPEVVALGRIAAIRNTMRVIGGGVPELNDPSVRELAHDRWKTYELLGGVGLAMNYARLPAGGSIDEALEVVGTDAVAVTTRLKTNQAQSYYGTKASITGRYKAGIIDSRQDWVIEEMLDFSPPLPVKGESPWWQADVALANSMAASKEIRTYIFGRDSSGTPLMSFVMRAVLDNQVHLGEVRRKDWVFIEPDTVPDQVVAQAATVLDAVEEQTGVQEIHMAVDSALVRRQDGGDIFLPTGVHASEPQLIRNREHHPTARVQAGLLADQLLRVAGRRGTK